MYILLFKPIKHQNVFMIFRWIIMLFSWSKYSHMARYDSELVREMRGEGYQEISLKQSLATSKSRIHAYKVIKPIDEKKAKAYNKKMTGVKFDVKGALYSEAEKWKWSAWIFKRKANDKKVFCAEDSVEFFQDQELFPIINANLFSPQEALERFKKLGIINSKYEVWK